MTSTKPLTLRERHQFIEEVLFEKEQEQISKELMLNYVAEEIAALPKFYTLYLFKYRLKRIIKSIFKN